MWVTKLLIFPVEIRIYCFKTTKFGPKLAFLVNLGKAMQAYLVPCWWVGWWLWRAGCISQDTYLLYTSASVEHLFAKHQTKEIRVESWQWIQSIHCDTKSFNYAWNFFCLRRVLGYRSGKPKPQMCLLGGLALKRLGSPLWMLLR